jgi:predicted nucleic acid-binding protein
MTADQPVIVLDSFAMLAYLGGEPGMDRVQAVLVDSGLMKSRVVMSIINLGEVLYITERELGLPKAQAVLAAIEQLPLVILPTEKDAVLAAAHIKASHRLAYADAFAAAAQATGGTILTGDPEFTTVQDLIPIEWLQV